MPVTAKLNYLRIAPRKVRLAADLIRGKSVEEAQTILNFMVKKAANPLKKLLNQASANAKHNFQLDLSDLYITKITVDEGPKYKRWQSRSRGRVSEIQKKTSHLTMVLDVVKGKKAKKIKKAEVKKSITSEPEKAEKAPQKGRAEKSRPKFQKEMPKPKIEKGLKRVFRRKAF